MYKMFIGKSLNNNHLPCWFLVSNSCLNYLIWTSWYFHYCHLKWEIMALSIRCTFDITEWVLKIMKNTSRILSHLSQGDLQHNILLKLFKVHKEMQLSSELTI